MVITHSEAFIYLASQRRCTISDTHCSYQVFNFDNADLNRKSFGDVIGFNDDVLAPGKSVSFTSPMDSFIYLIPVYGTLMHHTTHTQVKAAYVGQLDCISVLSGDVLTITNSENDLINFVHIWIKSDRSAFRDCIPFEFSLPDNTLVPFQINANGEAVKPVLQLGKYRGRAEEKHEIRNPSRGILVFVLEGAFEVNNRLLQARDSLVLRNETKLSFEALSGHAILFLLEC